MATAPVTNPYRVVNWINVPGAQFRMGGSGANEGPVRTVTVSPFAAAREAVRVDTFHAHCDIQQKAGMPFGRLLYDARGHVAGVIRGATAAVVKAQAVPNPMGSVRWSHASSVVKLVPTVEEHRQRYDGIAESERRFLQPDLPVGLITAHEAAFLAFCMVDANGQPCRLPTEAEWERVARADATGAMMDEDPVEVAIREDQVRRVHEQIHCGQECETGGPLPVHRGKPPHPMGFMHWRGNMWVWCADRYEGSYDPSDLTDPVGPLQGALHALRAGSWNYELENVRAAARDYNYHSNVGRNVAVRVVGGPRTPKT